MYQLLGNFGTVHGALYARFSRHSHSPSGGVYLESHYFAWFSSWDSDKLGSVTIIMYMPPFNSNKLLVYISRVGTFAENETV